MMVGRDKTLESIIKLNVCLKAQDAVMFEESISFIIVVEQHIADILIM